MGIVFKRLNDPGDLQVQNINQQPNTSKSITEYSYKSYAKLNITVLTIGFFYFSFTTRMNKIQRNCQTN